MNEYYYEVWKRWTEKDCGKYARGQTLERKELISTSVVHMEKFNITLIEAKFPSDGKYFVMNVRKL